MSRPEDAKYPAFITPKASNGKRYCIGLFPNKETTHPGHVYPALLREDGPDDWVEIDWRQPIWKDQQEMFDPASMMDLIISDFNITMQQEMAEAGLDPEDINNDGIVEWAEKLAAFFRPNRLAFTGDRFVSIK